MSAIRVEAVYPHPREKLWRALTDPQLLSRWLMPNDFEPRVGHRFSFRTEPSPGFDGVVRCEVKELLPLERLTITWVGGPIDTIVTFSLERVDGGTRLVVVQDGFRGLKSWLVSRILKFGNRTIYGRRLPALLNTMNDDQITTEPVQLARAEKCMSRRQGLVQRLLGWLEWRPSDD